MNIAVLRQATRDGQGVRIWTNGPYMVRAVPGAVSQSGKPELQWFRDKGLRIARAFVRISTTYLRNPDSRPAAEHVRDHFPPGEYADALQRRRHLEIEANRERKRRAQAAA